MQILIFCGLSILAIFISLVFVARPLIKHPGFCALTLLLVIVGITSGYYQWGASEKWMDYEEQKKRQLLVKDLLKTSPGKKAILHQLKEKIHQHPKDPKGWYLLGRLYISFQSFDEAVLAFEKAHALDDKNVATTVNYAQALWRKNNKQFNPEIRKMFQGLLDENPNQPDALAMLAIDAYDKGDLSLAIKHWEKLLDLTHPQSEAAKAIREALAQAYSKVSKIN